MRFIRDVLHTRWSIRLRGNSVAQCDQFCHCDPYAHDRRMNWSEIRNGVSCECTVIEAQWIE